jgi:hypothetical protein
MNLQQYDAHPYGVIKNARIRAAGPRTTYLKPPVLLKNLPVALFRAHAGANNRSLISTLKLARTR